jgi:hypothetical protein
MNTNTNALQDLSDLEAAELEGGLTQQQCITVYTAGGAAIGGVIGTAGSLGLLTPLTAFAGGMVGLYVGTQLCGSYPFAPNRA